MSTEAMNNGVPKYKRIILKVTGEVFAGPPNLASMAKPSKPSPKRSKKSKRWAANWRW